MRNQSKTPKDKAGPRLLAALDPASELAAMRHLLATYGDHLLQEADSHDRDAWFVLATLRWQTQQWQQDGTVPLMSAHDGCPDLQLAALWRITGAYALAVAQELAPHPDAVEDVRLLVQWCQALEREGRDMRDE